MGNNDIINIIALLLTITYKLYSERAYYDHHQGGLIPLHLHHHTHTHYYDTSYYQLVVDYNNLY